MADPLNVIAIDELRLTTGLEIKPVLSTSEAIHRAIVQYYGIKMAVTEIIAEEEEFGKIGEEELRNIETDEDIDVGELRRLVEEAPVVRLVNVIITQAIRDKASDIHIEPLKRELRIRFRIDGVLHNVMSPPKGIQPVLISRVKIMAGMDISERRVPQDGRIQLVVEGKEYDFRVSTYPTIFGEKVVMRILDKSGALIGLNKLGFQPQTQAMLEELIENPYGIILSTGPTGSGKTTTLYSCLNKLNTIEKNIITIEDPIEYQLDGINQIQVNEKAGLVFSVGLRHIVRQDPDIIMVGEIRDRETAEIAINAALTGHLVLSTLHTNDAPGATTRLIDMGIEPYLVASSLIGVLAQRLARTICPHCKESYEASSDALKKFGVYLDKKTVTLYRGSGCERCRRTGYLGRTGIFELMYVSDEIRELVVNKAPANVIKEQARKEGMKTLQEDCIDKVLAGITTIEEAIRIIFVEG
jgi:type IV pilus assembly protein PilB